ncbi:MAG: D-tyrosyl-tRNA(Tyr) deacylase [Synergistaceae bacterium]|nr:D-tyrosyl-tRNA(Tyr) deacylase [Synergistaceae bacterium]
MKVLLQRVSWAKITVNDKISGKIGPGLCVFLGVISEDTKEDISWLVKKVINLRIFEDENNKMNRSLLDENGEMLIVSQFTLCGNCSKGRRPSWIGAAEPTFAEKMYKYFIEEASKYGIKIATGVFQAHMQVEICNDGPVTLMIDSKERKKNED